METTEMSRYTPGGPPRFKHQLQGLNKMIATGGVCALLFDPGMGKTAVVLDYASILALKNHTSEARILVVCPLAAVDTWVLQADIFISPDVNYWAEAVGGGLTERAETLAWRAGNAARKNVWGQDWVYHAGQDPRAMHINRAWAFSSRPAVDPNQGPTAVPTPRIILEIINIDTLQYRTKVGSRTMADVMLDAIKRFNPDLLVVDESHKIKSVDGNASKLMGRVSKFVKRRAILTGTVMPHSPIDVFGQWRFLQPYAFGDPQPDRSVRAATITGFKSRYVIQGGWMGKEVLGFRNLDEMQTIMSRNAVVARKDQALDLPPTTDVTVPVTLSAREAKAYTEMKRDLAHQLETGAFATVPNKLSQMMRLRQITSGHLPDDTGHVNVIGDSKVQTIRSIVHDTLAGETRIVVFCFFTTEIHQLAGSLNQAGTEVMVITGETPTRIREQLRKRFGSQDPQRMVIVAQVKTLSLAVNELVTANHAIFGSLSQQRDDLIQARDRLDRIGQTRPVTYWYALAPGTVDEVILKSHTERTNLEDAMLAHIQATR
jgi:SNF2 family DNA or RNA helicase